MMPLLRAPLPLPPQGVRSSDRPARIVLKRAAEMTPPYGIELEDVRFRRINYVETVQQKVFERMISERKRIAERSRSEGQGRAAEIRGQKERDMLAASSVGCGYRPNVNARISRT